MANPKRRLKLKPNRFGRIRHYVQAAFAAVFLGLPTLQFHSVCMPVFHCYACPLSTFSCPIGILATFATLGAVAFAALGVVVLAGALVGSFVCGWACPFGFLQDLLAKVPLPKFKLPGWTGYGRYAVLILFVFLLPYLFGKDSPGFICNVCPAGGLEAAGPIVAGQAWRGETISWPSTYKIVIVAAFVCCSLVIYRPWCTVLCPLGAMLGSFNRVSAFFMRFSPKECKQCGLCTSACNMGIQPAKGQVHPSCIRCLECSRCTYIKPSTMLHKHHDDHVRR